MAKGNLILTIMAAAAAACGGAPAPAPAPGPDLPPTVVRVENQTYVDFNIFVFRNEVRERLGRSTANTTRNFRVPAYLLEGQPRIKIGADPIGSRISGITREIPVVPGDTVFLVIPPGG